MTTKRECFLFFANNHGAMLFAAVPAAGVDDPGSVHHHVGDGDGARVGAADRHLGRIRALRHPRRILHHVSS